MKKSSWGRAGMALCVCLVLMVSVPPLMAQSDVFETPAEENLSPFDTSTSCWEWLILPDGLLYGSYLAGPKEPRFGYSWSYDSYSGAWVNDATIGGRVGLLRLGTSDPVWPTGWQLDLEAAAMPRLTGFEDLDLTSADFRVGLPLTWREGPFQAKLGLYHLSSHVGDEYLVKNPDFERINYSRDSLVLGAGWFVQPDLRLYAEIGYAFRTDGGAQPWEAQFGWELAPTRPTCPHGVPFAAMNVLLREEVDWGGTFTAMAGWAWRGRHLFRAGVQYSVGETTQWQFLGNSEQLFGLGIWYDF